MKFLFFLLTGPISISSLPWVKRLAHTREETALWRLTPILNPERDLNPHLSHPELEWLTISRPWSGLPSCFSARKTESSDLIPHSSGHFCRAWASRRDTTRQAGLTCWAELWQFIETNASSAFFDVELDFVVPTFTWEKELRSPVLLMLQSKRSASLKSTSWFVLGGDTIWNYTSSFTRILSWRWWFSHVASFETTCLPLLKGCSRK